MTKTYLVYRQPRSQNWGVYEVSTGYSVLVEGGFFSHQAAQAARDRWARLGY